MAKPFTIKRGDRLRRLRLVLKEPPEGEPEAPVASWLPVDLTGAERVSLVMKHTTDDLPPLVGTCTVASALGGVADYDWRAGDTNVAGIYNAEVEVLRGGLPETFPNDGYFTIDVKADLGGL